MALQSDFSVFRLFANHSIMIFDENNPFDKVIIKIPSLREKYENSYLNIFYGFFNQGISKFKEMFRKLNLNCDNEFDALKCIFQLGYLKEFNYYYSSILNSLEFFFNSKIEYINDTFTIVNQKKTLDLDLFNYVMYLLRLAEGMKVEPPRTFKSDADRKQYEKLLEQEEKIRKIRANGVDIKNSGNLDPMKGFISILIAFPQYSIEDIFNFTSCQIVSLQSYAARIIKYDVEKRAYAAGNLKKLKNFLE